jgi:hypothetical protein
MSRSARLHAHSIGDVLHRDLGAQLVEAELVGEVLRQRAGRIDQETAAMAGRDFGDQEIGRDLALRRQQRAEPAKAGLQQRDVCSDETIEEVAGILAADLDHAPVRKKRCFHEVNRPLLTCFLKLASSSWGNAGAGYHTGT